MRSRANNLTAEQATEPTNRAGTTRDGMLTQLGWSLYGQTYSLRTDRSVSPDSGHLRVYLTFMPQLVGLFLVHGIGRFMKDERQTIPVAGRLPHLLRRRTQWYS